MSSAKEEIIARLKLTSFNELKKLRIAVSSTMISI